MIQSMTGFGKSQKQTENFSLSVEIKSLNSKGVDLNLKLPPIFREKELEIRKNLSDRLLRGKIDALISFENSAEKASVIINQEMVKNYISQLKQIVQNPANDLDFLQMAVRMPEVYTSFQQELSQEHYQLLCECLGEALTELENFRRNEGEALKQDFLFRKKNIEAFLEEISVLDIQRTEQIRERLLKSVAELKDKFDENRFEQELIFYLEKLDITEEKVRLKNHLSYFEEVLEEENSGRKLGFIAQEIGREINTIGSKANFAPIQQLVVKMKDELEKIKEQSANVL